MKQAGWQYYIGLLVYILVFTSPCFGAFIIKPVNLPDPGFTNNCHPSYDTFLASTMAADFTTPVTEGDAPFTLKFYDVSYGYADSWLWDFGDGNTSTDRNPVYTYLAAGTYGVSLKIYNKVNYETPMTEYNETGKGQYTDYIWESNEYKPLYIKVYPTGTGVYRLIPEGWRPESKKQVTLPSGINGSIGSAGLKANEITLININGTGLSTERGYIDTLNVNGAYYLVQSIPYNTAF